MKNNLLGDIQLPPDWLMITLSIIASLGLLFYLLHRKMNSEIKLKDQKY